VRSASLLEEALAQEVSEVKGQQCRHRRLTRVSIKKIKKKK
jgi:hypothetical protein